MTAFAINQITAPALGFEAFLDLARACGCDGVELRNDLGRPLFDGLAPGDVAALAGARGLSIYAIAELARFDDVTHERIGQAERLCRDAAASGATAIALIPRNDGTATGKSAIRDVTRALGEYLPLLRAHGLMGYVEPLGFASASLRLKSDALDAIAAVGGQDRLRIVHDTFHHHLSGEGAFYPAETGIVHVSSVTDPAVKRSDMADAHRHLVDPIDRLGSIQQLQSLIADGYQGPVSFEPFSEAVQRLNDHKTHVLRSIEFIRSQLCDIAA